MARVIGAVIGYWLAGWLGAIAGFFIAGYFGRGLEQNLREGYQHHAQGADIFFDVTFQLLGKMAKSDGRVSEEEIAQAESLMQRLAVGGDKRQQAIDSFKYGSSERFDLDQSLRRFTAAGRFRPDLKRNLITFLVEMAMADGELHSDEEAVLRRVAMDIGIDDVSFEQMLEMLRAQHEFAGGHASREGDLAAAYRALGVTPSANDKDVKRAYRKLISEYHPDKMIAKGVPEAMIAIATDKAQEIQGAYDLIEKSRR